MVLGLDLLWWAVIFLIVAIIAGIFGFGGIARGSATIAKWIFIVAIVVFLVFLVMAFFG